MQHLDEGTVHAWLDGALPTAEAREVEQHVAECSTCSAMVAEARGLIAGASRIVSSLDVVRGNVIPKKPAAGGGKSIWHSLHLTPARAALAATVMIAVSTLLTVRHDTSQKMVLTAPAAAAPAGPLAEPASADAKLPATPPSPTPTNAPVVADAAPAREAVASQRKEKDRAEAIGRPTGKAKADLATNESVRLDSLSTGAAAKSAVVAAAPPAAQSPPPATAGASANAIDTTLKKSLAKVAELDSIRVEQRQARARSAPAFASQNSAFVPGPTCFQFAERPASGLPQRFALGTLVGDSTQRIVRAVNETGRLDSVLAGSSWTRVTPTEITVRFASNDRLVTLPVRDASLGLASTSDEAKRAGPSVTRMLCRQ